MGILFTNALKYRDSTAASWSSLAIAGGAQPGTVIPNTDGDIAAVGTSLKFAREDHQHQRECRLGTITLSSVWTGDDPYTQSVTINGTSVTNHSKVDLQPDASAITQLIDDGVSALFIANNSGILTAYSIGAALSTELTLQATVVEVTL